MLQDLLISVAIAEIVIVGVLLVRVGRGPSIGDRIVALNMISTQCALAILFYAAFAHRTVYCDVALWVASFSYLGTFVWSRFLERGLL
jgi:multicomponent Na+:H+ antiporter subunit F